MSEGADLRVSETGEERDDVVHHVLIIDDAVLTLPHEHHDKFTQVHPELLPHGAWHDQRVVSALLQ